MGGGRGQAGARQRSSCEMGKEINHKVKQADVANDMTVEDDDNKNRSSQKSVSASYNDNGDVCCATC